VSYLATLKRDGEGYLDANELYHETAEDALSSVFGFCGCGAPELALAYMGRVMRAIQNLQGDGSFEDRHAAYEEASNALFHGDDGARYVAYYLLAERGLTEHGGSVPGWLSDRGVGVLFDIEALPEA
jgi:hypothetical protein